MIKPCLHLVLALVVSASTAAVRPRLPDSFVTKAGATIKGGTITEVSEKGVKVMHDGGIVVLAPSQFPDDLRTALGLADTTASDPGPLPALPDPLKVKGKVFVHPVLTGIDPDGIRFVHETGSARLDFEQLRQDLQELLGFDADKAAAFRKARDEEEAKARAALQKEEEESLARVREERQTAAATKTDAADSVQTNPDSLTLDVNVKLSGKVQGGKSRYEPWKTDYGSYRRIDTSSYQLVCNLTTIEPSPQRVRMQAFRLSRNLDTHDFEVKLVGDFNVVFSRTQPKTVGTICEASNSDDKYVMLGIRDRSGDKYVGWVWRAIDGKGRVCGVVSSQSAFDHYGREQPLDP